MENYLKIIKETKAFINYHEDSFVQKTFLKGEILQYNRIKRRNGIDWFEIYFNSKKLYIKKDFSTVFVLKKVKLDDETSTVIFYKSKINEQSDINQIFTPYKFEEFNQSIIRIQRIFDDGNKKKIVDLYYNDDKFEVSKSFLSKNDEFTITEKKGFFIEILYGKRLGYVLADTSYLDFKDNVIRTLTMIVVVLAVIAGLVAFLSSNLTVLPGVVILIPVLIIGIIFFVLFQVLYYVIAFIYENIRKRF